jgi:hypothetical protein
MTNIGLFIPLLAIGFLQVQSLQTLFEIVQKLERDRVLSHAKPLLNSQPITITSVQNPRSAGGIHDYSSEADYWWPNPADPDGPYIRKDGITNPDCFNQHRFLMMNFSRDFGFLASAYVLTGDSKFAEAASIQLDAWFANEDTKMNPNLLYAQAIKGIDTGRGIGIIDTVQLVDVAVGALILQKKGVLSESVWNGTFSWFSNYLDFIINHPYGVSESEQKNNHGTCWTLQQAAFAKLVGKADRFDNSTLRLIKTHLPEQMAANGSFPLELARTKPYSYSMFNLDIMSTLAHLVSTVDTDYTAYKLEDGRSVFKGIEFMAPYIADKSKWFLPPDVEYWEDQPARQNSLLFGYFESGMQESGWLQAWSQLNADPQVDEIRRNNPIRQPLLYYVFR